MFVLLRYTSMSLETLIRDYGCSIEPGMPGSPHLRRKLLRWFAYHRRNMPDHLPAWVGNLKHMTSLHSIEHHFFGSSQLSPCLLGSYGPAWLLLI
jgi:hypothetical protein